MERLSLVVSTGLVLAGLQACEPRPLVEKPVPDVTVLPSTEPAVEAAPVEGDSIPTRESLAAGVPERVGELARRQGEVQRRLDGVIAAIARLEESPGEPPAEAVASLRAEASSLVSEAEQLAELAASLREDSEKIRSLATSGEGN